jgi:hypothetical protein
MPQEPIGLCGNQSERSDWNIAELEIGICYIKHACGDPPPGFELEVVWHEHELGDYPMVGLIWDGPSYAPWEYISRAERALDRLNAAVEWSALEPADVTDESEDEEDDPPEEISTVDEAAPGADLASLHPPVQTTLEAVNDVELYNREGMLEVKRQDWHMALLIFREMGWKSERPVEAYANPFLFVQNDEGAEMQSAGRNLFTLIEQEPAVGVTVQMDLGLFCRLTEFVGGGAFIVGRPGSFANAKEADFEQRSR